MYRKNLQRLCLISFFFPEMVSNAIVIQEINGQITAVTSEYVTVYFDFVLNKTPLALSAPYKATNRLSM